MKKLAEAGRSKIKIAALVLCGLIALIIVVDVVRQEVGSAALRSSNGDINPTRHTYMIEVVPKK
ncbi:hypothetical protein [uncultured Thiodictyon sp.]|uniref:hypothetical protein n=1 Tax=uncultured Thiodictyon sp. TaxID=1846217 RepID=UPI0025F4A4DA|nr:hypothetical protein [uncultured Thiodictyon sp.]